MAIIWLKCGETTWIKYDGWAGETFGFYTDYENRKICIHQILESDVFASRRFFATFEVVDSF